MMIAIGPLSPANDKRISRPVCSLSIHPAQALLAGEMPALVGIDERTGEA